MVVAAAELLLISTLPEPELSALMLVATSSIELTVPIPVAAFRSMVPLPALISVLASPAPTSLTAPALVIVIRSPSAIIESTSTLPLVTVVSVRFLLVPPAVSEVAVRLPPVEVTLTEPSLVLADVIVVAASFVTTRLPAPLIVALTTVRVWDPVWSKVMLPVAVLRLLTVTAPVPAVASELRSTAPVVVSALIDLPVSSRALVLPMPAAALRSMVPEPTLISAPASALADSLMAPTLVIVTVLASAVRIATVMSPLVTVLAVMLPVPPAVSVVSVRLPPVVVTSMLPSLVVAVVMVVAASLVTTRLPAPEVMVALVTVSVCEPV